jgi:peptidoglycan hydrolase-like protein with peptidoglycan-binding domain
MSALKEALVARVSYLRPAVSPERSALRAHRRLTAAPRRNRRGRFAAGGVLLVILAVLGAGALVLVSAKASLTTDSNALASVGMPLGGGKIESVTVNGGPHNAPIPVELRGDQIWPQGLIPAHRIVQVDVVIKRPGWIAWLAGKTEHLHLTMMTPSASLRQHYETLRPGEALTLRFRQPVRVLAVGTPGHLARRTLHQPLSTLKLHRSGEAGTVLVAAQMRTWETSPPAVVSWFPAGAATAAVAAPSPGSQITPLTPITLTFSKPVPKALGSSRPPVSPAGSGTWVNDGPRSIQFKPSGYGYGLGTTVSIGLPNGVHLVGGQQSGNAEAGTWSVPGGSPLRLQQLLAQLGYLPLKFHGKHVALTPQAQELAAIHPPSGHFVWRYPNTPDWLHGMWAPGSAGEMTKGAIMAFQNDHGFTTVDGVAGPAVWKSLITAAAENKVSTFGYSAVNVSLSGQNLTLWHSGKTIVDGTAVNTGIPSRPTDPGTFAVYSHLRVTTMSGTNPDGSHYDDPGIQFVSYFNGGDALHAFTRAQYGFPQSLGCVEMQLGPAGQVWPYTPIGTLVHVA